MIFIVSHLLWWFDNLFWVSYQDQNHALPPGQVTNLLEQVLVYDLRGRERKFEVGSFQCEERVVTHIAIPVVAMLGSGGRRRDYEPAAPHPIHVDGGWLHAMEPLFREALLRITRDPSRQFLLERDGANGSAIEREFTPPSAPTPFPWERTRPRV